MSILVAGSLFQNENRWTNFEEIYYEILSWKPLKLDAIEFSNISHRTRENVRIFMQELH
jgi:hypothetical protein